MYFIDLDGDVVFVKDLKIRSGIRQADGISLVDLLADDGRVVDTYVLHDKPMRLWVADLRRSPRDYDYWATTSSKVLRRIASCSQRIPLASDRPRDAGSLSGNPGPPDHNRGSCTTIGLE